MKSYKDLDIYKKSFSLAIQIHKMSMNLPKYEMYELGSQIRRSSQSVRTNIVEGYGRKDYKNEYIRFLVFSHASNLETLNHLLMLKELYEISNIDELIFEIDGLGKQIYTFKEYVRKNWKTNN
jgi:four helix bundle protein